ncbi:MAG: hypothetical protein AAF652_19525, partial [Cyanobacteria bacterium P01_C01_bin.72]
ELSRLNLEVGSTLPKQWQAESKARANYCRKRINFLQSRELERLEIIVKDGLTVFYRVGEALAEICDRQLYKQQGYSDFREYLKERWNMGKSRAYQLITSAEVMNNLKSVHHGGQLQLPDSERVAREIAKVPPENQIGVWRTAVQEYGENPTAKEVKAVVSDFQNQEQNNSPSPEDKQAVQTSQSNCPDKESTVQTSCPDLQPKSIVEGYEVDQLIRINTPSDRPDKRLVGHCGSVGIVTQVLDNSINIKIFNHHFNNVSPNDVTSLMEGRSPLITLAPSIEDYKKLLISFDSKEDIIKAAIAAQSLKL